MPPLTTIAGRHAADRERDRCAQQRQQENVACQDAARERLLDAYRTHALVCYPHFHEELENERSLWVECRLARPREDHALVYAILDDLGWQPDRARMSRTQARYDVLRITHRDSGAKLALIIKLPLARAEFQEAAA